MAKFLIVLFVALLIASAQATIISVDLITMGSPPPKDECVCDDSWDTAPCHSWITDPSRDCGFYYASNGQCEELGEGCVTQGGDGTAAPAVVEIAFVVSFTEEVGLIDEIRACNALVTDIAALDGIDEDYFECGMTLSDGSTSFVYNTEIVITIPATALAMSEGVTMVEDLQATVADTRALTDVVSTSLETALPNNVGTVTSKSAAEGDLDEACSKVDGCKTGLSCKLYDATGVARRLRRGLMFTKGSSKMRCTADAGTD